MRILHPPTPAVSKSLSISATMYTSGKLSFSCLRRDLSIVSLGARCWDRMQTRDLKGGLGGVGVDEIGREV